MKTCTKCKIEKEFTEFSKDKNSKDNLKWFCKKCLNSLLAPPIIFVFNLLQNLIISHSLLCFLNLFLPKVIIDTKSLS